MQSHEIELQECVDEATLQSENMSEKTIENIAKKSEKEAAENAVAGSACALAGSAALRARMAQRQEVLAHTAQVLKSELFGLDVLIDRVIDSVRAWYLLPELIERPVIVCLWGLTGTGKTQLVRRLVQLLGFYDRFVEVQMDGFSWATTTSSTRRCRARRTSA